MIDAPPAGEAATAAGNRAPNVIAKVAARNASDRINDQFSGDRWDTDGV